MGNKKYIISGGGTGGHIFPALAIAKELKSRSSDVEILFVGANGRMEMTKVPESGFDIVGLDVVGLQRSLSLNSILKNLQFPFKLIKSLLKAKKIIKTFSPNVVIGVGGYASGPTLKMANKLNIPTLIQEQNSYAGLTNKLLSKGVKRICVAYANMDVFFPKEKLVLTGNPVRKDIIDLTLKIDEARKSFSISSECKVVLVLGGSLGARSINEGLLKNLNEVKSNNIHIIWQTGSRYFEKINSDVKKQEIENVTVLSFIKKMDFAYAASDIIVSRAGALSISEISIVGKPSILVPSPNVSEDHQTKNAMSLVQQQAAILVKDEDSELILSKAIELINDEDKCTLLKRNISALGRPNASKDIVDEIVKITDK